MRTSSTLSGRPLRSGSAGEEMSRLGAQRAMDVVQLRRHMKPPSGRTSGTPVTLCTVTRSPGWIVRTGAGPHRSCPSGRSDRGRELVVRGRHRITSRASSAKLRLPVIMPAPGARGQASGGRARGRRMSPGRSPCVSGRNSTRCEQTAGFPLMAAVRRARAGRHRRRNRTDSRARSRGRRPPASASRPAKAATSMNRVERGRWKLVSRRSTA